MNRAAHNRAMLWRLAAGAVAMFGFGYLLVPFYDAICDATGLNNLLKPDVVENTQVDVSRNVMVQFDTNLHDLPWHFRPLQASVTVHPGELAVASFEVRNDLQVPVTGQAVPSYGPQLAARYFRKLECFCFAQQTLAPGEVRTMPVAFVIDPELPPDVAVVTLSYTFFSVAGRTLAQVTGAGGGT